MNIPQMAPHWLANLRPACRRRPEAGTLTLEGAFRFHSWAAQLHAFPTVAQIIDKFGCHRATAFRYRNALANAYGVEPPNMKPGAGQSAPNTQRSTRTRRGVVAGDAISFHMEPRA